MTTDPVQQQVAEALHEALGYDDFGSANDDERQEMLDLAQALADRGLLPTGRTEWAWKTPGGPRIHTGFNASGGEVDARTAVESQGGTVQSRTVFTAPDPTPWRDA